ncbi:NAD(P)/FAD-dependent oxidoreductase [Longivirga aurantiaca]|uniref:NAD(P)/FAD-dependent oxidoreductase n=1 Tax=Longivirga aurantiaca TaxID=1837743 RepID=A0ABW1SXJ3_9ACTN
MQILILGAGFGGLELASRLSEELGDAVDVVLVDKGDGFVFGFSKLDVMFGRVSPEHVVHRFADIAKPGVTFVQAEVTGIDPVARRVTTTVGELVGDVLVVALGADLHPELTPGLLEGGHEFYTVAGAFAVADVLRTFEGGRVVVGVTSTPFKCPPAPSETTLMVHDLLEARGLLEVSSVELVLPLPVPIPPSPQASTTILETFAERGIAFRGGTLVTALDPERKVALLSDGTELPYDLFLGVPVHRAPAVVVEAGLTEDGWIPVDALTLETRYPDVYAVGDVTSVGTPKAGVFAEGQADIVASAIIARVRGGDAAEYDGHGICYMEFGHQQIAMVDVYFQKGVTPHGDLIGPSTDLMAEKSHFGTSRVRRWFGREWYAVDEPGTPPR